MKLTLFSEGFQVSFEIKKLNHHGNEFFVFEAIIDADLFNFLEAVNLIYKQHTGNFTICRGVQFQIE